MIALRLLLRDLAILLLTLLLWQASHGLDAQGSAWSVPVALLAGGMIAVSGFLAHEWGHLLGAWAGRSVVYLPATLRSVFLFRYDPLRNSRGQFLLMSCGGFIASGLVIWLLLEALSLDVLADQVALGLTALGVLATAVLELPPAWRVYRGAPIPREGAVYHTDPAPGGARR